VAGVLGGARPPLNASRSTIPDAACRRRYSRRAVTAADPLPTATFNCPRCATEVTERFWGPCTDCRQQLAQSTIAAQRDAAGYEATRFEPAMHVTPNHVATKD